MPTLIDIRGLEGSSATGGGISGRGFRVTGSRKATLTTAMAGENNDLVFTAKASGATGNDVRVRVVVAGAGTALSVAVAGNDITVNSATNGSSVATTTAAQALAAVLASGPATALVDAALAPGNNGTGVIAAFAYTNLAGGAASSGVKVNVGANATVDVDDPAVRRSLRNNRQNFIEVLGGAILPVIRGLDVSEAAAGPSQSRGFRVKNSAGTLTRVNQGAATTVDITDGNTRRNLRRNHSRFVAASAGSNLITIRGLDRSEATGGLASRGFRVTNQAGNQASVGPNANVQVNLDDPAVRKALRRNKSRFVVVSSP